jgi:hypothetical protein
MSLCRSKRIVISGRAAANWKLPGGARQTAGWIDANERITEGESIERFVVRDELVRQRKLA